MQVAIKSVRALSIALGVVALITGCGGGSTPSSAPVQPVQPAPPVVIDNSGTPGSLIQNPPTRLTSLQPAGITSQLQSYGNFGTQLLSSAGAPKCGVDFYHFEYATVGAAGEATTASGGILVPTGSDPACTGPRPVLLYGHGSSLNQYVNMADISSANPYLATTAEIEALFAAQGYIVVAPNYAGYDTSTLPYHAEHIASQNGQEMIHALTAARKSFPNLSTPVVDNGKLFLSGYSEGGYVTMATHRAMQAAGMTVTASVPQSGDYAVATNWEFLGQPGALDDISSESENDQVGLLFQFTAYQKAYGNLYAKPSDFYSTSLSGSLETLLPTRLDPDNLVALGLFPKYLLGNDMPNYPDLTPFEQSFFGPPAQSLLKTSAVSALVADVAANPCPVTSATAPLNCNPSNPIRIDAIKNDLRTWTPTQPMLMCGGNGDPEVGFINAQLAQAYFQAHGATTTVVLDVDSPITANDPYADAKNAFLIAKATIVAAGGDPATENNYHGNMASAGCNVAARDFFSRF